MDAAAAQDHGRRGVKYTTRPLTIEARTRLRGVRLTGSPFSASWPATLDLLDRELWELGVRDSFIIQIDVREQDLRLDGELRAHARPASPAVAISVDRKGKPSLLFVCGKFPRWQDNVRAIALGLEALRKVERYGITSAEEQYTGFGALPPGTPMPAAKMTVDEAADFIAGHCQHVVLAGEPPVTRKHVFANLDSAYRAAARHLHPDVGGDPALFRQLTEARDILAHYNTRSS